LCCNQKEGPTQRRGKGLFLKTLGLPKILRAIKRKEEGSPIKRHLSRKNTSPQEKFHFPTGTA
jgi:hypothetical protein